MMAADPFDAIDIFRFMIPKPLGSPMSGDVADCAERLCRATSTQRYQWAISFETAGCEFEAGGLCGYAITFVRRVLN